MGNHNIHAYTLLALLFMATIDFTVAQLGVCYGMLGGSLPSPSQVVTLFSQNNIRRMRIYAPHQPTLQALAGSNIELMLGVPNSDLQSIAANQANADTWVQNNVRNHPNVRFRYIAVGNEVSPFRPESRDYRQFLLVAMSNIYNAIQSAGYGNRIRVSTPIDTGLLSNSYPPSDGAFNSEVISFIDPIIRFLVNTRQPLLANIYPYFAYTDARGDIDLPYALFTSDGHVVPGGTRYQNLFYAMLDATYAAVAKRGGASLEIVVSETGWPSAGQSAATLDNSRAYNTNLLSRVRDGTPGRAGPIETYVFAMFDEDQKPGVDTERNFGIFRANAQPKYPMIFN